MDVFLNIAEEKIRQAIRNGDLDNIPGKGKPLQLEDLSMVPPELRMSYKILKNAGMIPRNGTTKRYIKNRGFNCLLL